MADWHLVVKHLNLTIVVNWKADGLSLSRSVVGSLPEKLLGVTKGQMTARC